MICLRQAVLPNQSLIFFWFLSVSTSLSCSEEADVYQSTKTCSLPLNETRTSFRCPENGDPVPAARVCDGFADCTLSHADESSCIDFISITKANGTGAPDMFTWHQNYVLTVYVPGSNCVAPVCFENVNDLVAHTFCRQLNMLTYRRFEAVVNGQSLPAVAPGMLTCLGYESVLQQCFVPNDRLSLERCHHLATIDCAQECRFLLRERNGTITPAGYPHYYLPFTDCTWDIRAPFGYMIVAKVVEMHIGVRKPQECTRSYVDLFLSGNHVGSGHATKPFTDRVRICADTTYPQTFVSRANHLRIHYVTDAMVKADSTARQGFMLHYHVIPDPVPRRRREESIENHEQPRDNRSGDGDDDGQLNGQLDATKIALITTVVLLAAMIVIGMVFGLPRWLRNMRIAKIKKMNDDLTKRRMINLRALLEAPDKRGYYYEPLYCLQCERHFQKDDTLCPHLKFFVQVVRSNKSGSKLLPCDLCEKSDLYDDFSAVTNFTIDIEELVSVKSMDKSVGKTSDRSSAWSKRGSKKGGDTSAGWQSTNVTATVSTPWFGSRLYHSLRATFSTPNLSTRLAAVSPLKKKLSTSGPAAITVTYGHGTPVWNVNDGGACADARSYGSVHGGAHLQLPGLPGRHGKKSLRQVNTKLTNQLRKIRMRRPGSANSGTEGKHMTRKFN